MLCQVILKSAHTPPVENSYAVWSNATGVCICASHSHAGERSKQRLLLSTHQVSEVQILVGIPRGLPESVRDSPR